MMLPQLIKPLGDTMRTRTAAAALATAALLTLTACEGADTAGSSGTARDTNSNTGEESKAETATLPDMTGKGLQSAQDQAQEQGFYSLTSHDATGRARLQAFDRNWKVCSQTPKAGEHPTDTKIDFATVKLEEDCPAKDAGADKGDGKPASAMPDFKGKSVKAARQALDGNTSLTVEDASGQDRIVFVESNWQVCSQSPSPGTKLDGQPVKLSAVKFEESC